MLETLEIEGHSAALHPIRGWGWPCRLSDDEIKIDSVLPARVSRCGGCLVQSVRRRPAQDIGVHVDRGESGNEVLGQIGVVKSRDRYILGDAKPVIRERLNQSHGRQIIHGHHRRGPRRRFKK